MEVEDIFSRGLVTSKMLLSCSDKDLIATCFAEKGWCGSKNLKRILPKRRGIHHQ